MTTPLTRRQALVGLAAVAVLAGCRPAGALPPSQPADRLDLAGIEDRHGARIGMYAVDLGSGTSLAHGADDRFAMCSTFKTYAAARVLQLADQDRLQLDTPVPVTESDIVTHAPVTGTKVGQAMSLAELCAAALIESDNTAGNLLLRTIGGPSAITEFARSVGDDQTRLDRWETELNAALPGDLRDTTTPRALGIGYREVLTGTALSDTARERLLTWMRSNITAGKRFRAALPPGWTSADKTGAGDYGTTNDAGLLIGPAGQRVIMVVLTRSRDDQPEAGPYNDAIAETVDLTLEALGHR
ncbi:class A beta-lactamase [[Mycobacterium] wendilense]|uniref:Beta-lactamase n=1 Tax=[Mycobacterium] wendilense TaxID=3064284 RepID=A0ABM9MDX6_9MYCO|nr:class A beta-lactamase [Mycolicibacterium sp. MU0050]CAJ1582819.1 class A beta-lactamase [Mycolicibacterium sp. MU0050]